MFDNAGQKLRIITTVYFMLCVLAAFVLLIAMTIAEMFLLGVLYAALSLFAAWLGGITMMALAEAAESAQYAASYAEQALRTAEKILAEIQKEKGETVQKTVSTPRVAPAKAQDYEKIPAWKRVQEENK
ncbi:MAG: hypothetical protein IKU07_05860 [Oscillospiraceae bacterium]|nr:hypothetical protein [Oscillospiraceae bacterium]